MMSRPFAQTMARKFAPIKRTTRPVATINGRPAWQVVEERKRQEREAAR